MRKTGRWIGMVQGLVLALYLLVGCGGRGHLAPEEAILGHWESSTGLSNYFIGKKAIVLSEKVLNADGSYREQRRDLVYTVLDSNEKDRWIKIQIQTPQGGHIKTVSMAPDGTSLTESVSLLGVTMTDTWKYVDDCQIP
jgi:hypothetical protein